MPNSTKQGGSLHLWLSLDGTGKIPAEQIPWDMLTPSEEERLALINHPAKRREFIHSRKLMRHALNTHFQKRNGTWEFTCRPDSPPIITNLPENTHISLSHSNGLACFAIAQCPVGIDVESIGKKRDFQALAKLFMHSDELKLLSENRENAPETFYRTWCAKEAHYKALSPEQQMEISFRDISLLKIARKESQWFFFEGRVDQFMISVALTEEPTKISCSVFSQSHSPFLKEDFSIKPLQINR